ncbi:MAG: hypothetical protein IJ587_00385 [Synergistaceae bacterium]|nr:hypothetical protein [Synergistaceae bacterium]
MSTTILNSETIIKRGVDWILTDKSLILSSDDEPYITRTEYEDSDTTYIDKINQSCSFFPEFETWSKIYNRQNICIADAPSDKWKTIDIIDVPSEAFLELSQGTIGTIEFHYYNNKDINVYANFKPQLYYCNGKIYGKGKAHIGRAYLLPRRFNINGNPVSFYLYISPDYLRSYDKTNKEFNDNDGWDRLLIAQLNQDSICVFAPENENYGLCKKAENGKVFSLQQNEQIDFSTNNGAIFFDGLTHSNLMLNENGASFLRENLLYTCNGLHQWLIPSKKVETISAQFVISSFDNATLITHIQQGFHRELISGDNHVLSVKQYLDKNLFISDTSKNNKKIFRINTIRNTINKEAALWNMIYCSFISVDFLYEAVPFDVMYGYDSSFRTGTIVPISRYDTYDYELGNIENTVMTMNGNNYSTAWSYYGYDTSGVVIPSFTYIGTTVEPGTYDTTYTIHFSGYNPETNEHKDLETLIGTLHQYVEEVSINHPNPPDPYVKIWYKAYKYTGDNKEEPDTTIRDGKIGEFELPEYVKKYTTYNNVKKNPTRIPLTIQTEIAPMKFFDNELILGDRDSITQDWLGNNYYLHTIHFLEIGSKHYAYSLRFHPEIFDFNQEWQRSKLF